MRIGVDIDGVLAAFYGAYENLFIRISGEDHFYDKRWPDYYPETWNWPGDKFGYTPETTKLVWAEIKKDPSFWRRLPPMPEWDEYFEWAISNIPPHEVYYVTDRSGVLPKFQTESWFDAHGMPYATVLISSQKGAIAYGLGLDLYVDDKFENIKNVEEISPMTRAVLINRPYNQLDRFPGQKDVKERADTLMEVLPKSL